MRSRASEIFDSTYWPARYPAPSTPAPTARPLRLRLSQRLTAPIMLKMFLDSVDGRVLMISRVRGHPLLCGGRAVDVGGRPRALIAVGSSPASARSFPASGSEARESCLYNIYAVILLVMATQYHSANLIYPLLLFNLEGILPPYGVIAYVIPDFPGFGVIEAGQHAPRRAFGLINA